MYPVTHFSRGMFPPLDLPFKPAIRTRSRLPCVISCKTVGLLRRCAWDWSDRVEYLPRPEGSA